MLYDPTLHPLLSDAARRLDPLHLDARATAAETILAREGVSLADTAFEEGAAEYDRAVLAVVYQVNYELEAGTEAEVYGSVTRGNRQYAYRGDKADPMPIISPRAQAIIDALIPLPASDAESTDWPLAGSLR